MTTPAVDIKAIKLYDTRNYFYSASYPSGYLTVQNKFMGYLSRKRGQSVSSPMTLGHFRYPTYWRHEGGYVPEGFEATFEFGERDRSRPFSYTRYLDGNGTGPDRYIASTLVIPDFLEPKAINKLLLEIKGQKVNLSQAFAERQQTIDLVAGITDDIYKKILAFRSLKGAKWWSKFKKMMAKQRASNPTVPLSRYVTNLTRPVPVRPRKQRRPRKGADLTDERITQDWLAFQYGLLPLMSDAYGIMAALDEREKADSHFYRSYQKTKVGQLINAEREDLYQMYVLRANGINVIYRTSTFYGVSAECQFEIENDLIANLGSLGVINPAVLAWELLPFSFVVDWFLPVGNYLNAMDATAGWKFLSGSVSKVAKLEGSIVGMRSTFWHHLPKGMSAEVENLSRAPSRLFKFERQVMSNFPGPRMPEWKNPITLGHFANASALLVQLFR